MRKNDGEGRRLVVVRSRLPMNPLVIDINIMHKKIGQYSLQQKKMDNNVQQQLLVVRGRVLIQTLRAIEN
jgi:hypothetical protein